MGVVQTFNSFGGRNMFCMLKTTDCNQKGFVTIAV